MTLKMTTAQVVETSVTVTNSSFQNYTHPDDHTTRTSIVVFSLYDWTNNKQTFDFIQVSFSLAVQWFEDAE